MTDHPTPTPDSIRAHCVACRNCLGGVCDILGVITPEAIERCKQSGYKVERKPSPWSTRRYYNRRGAL